MNRRIQTVKGTLIAVAIVCLISTISSTFARYSGINSSHVIADSITKIKTVIASSTAKY